ncbi:hypothetical protein EXIGLDRAFT_613989 [Exidia glandulosa HHB12029]|uniref:Uncharacterized protein n=1 Tax=Exidia glandulosa HHB12029 TaxID=1314781 RepID=A0A165I018_EXIGL|nr:hypothetical protein EXIGLDRAFT_613989 [Exidia glandulosa HHB12029]
MPRSQSRSRSRSPELARLPAGAARISESDYFLKASEFRTWLKGEKDRYFDELSSDKARKYFKKFIKAWNRGALPRQLYDGVDPTTVKQTAYKWKFVDREGGKADRDAMQRVRSAVAEETYGPTLPSSSSRRVQGPTLPSSSDLQLAREVSQEEATLERIAGRKRARADERDRVEDMVGPREVGREAIQEKKRAKREADKSFRDAKDDDGGDINADALMGGDSFQAAIARRDAARKRFEEKKGTGRQERDMEGRERRSAILDREKATMDMFKQMAKERFG